VGDAREITVHLTNGSDYPAELIGKDDRRDLAMVSFRSRQAFPLAVLGDSDAVRVGDWAIAVGNPLGLVSSVTMGIISAVGRSGGPGGNINDFIQTDASINMGNSGGALINIRGEVIGINTWIASSNTGGGSVGLGFAIPINNAKRSIGEFIASGEISYGWLGVSLVEADRETASALRIEGRRGALATQIFLGSPADAGGIRPGDFITHVNGREARNVNYLTMMVGDLRPGEVANIAVIRDGEPRNFNIRIEVRTDEVAGEGRSLWPGVSVLELTDALRERLNIDRNARGLHAAQVLPETPAAVIGLQRGDRITGINGEPVNNLASFYRVLRERTNAELWFSISRGTTDLETLRFRR
jgi:Do/DeqQ family serine protease